MLSSIFSASESGQLTLEHYSDSSKRTRSCDTRKTYINIGILSPTFRPPLFAEEKSILIYMNISHTHTLKNIIKNMSINEIKNMFSLSKIKINSSYNIIIKHLS